MRPGSYVTRMAADVVSIADGSDTTLALISVTIADGTTAILIILATGVGLIGPRLLIDRFGERPRWAGAKLAHPSLYGSPRDGATTETSSSGRRRPGEATGDGGRLERVQERVACQPRVKRLEPARRLEQNRRALTDVTSSETDLALQSPRLRTGERVAEPGFGLFEQRPGAGRRSGSRSGSQAAASASCARRRARPAAPW